jgi:3',5'-cyclic AMP phosphodiesterase CpdA
VTFLLLQLSDPHIGAEWGTASGPTPADGVRHAVEAILALPDRPDALVLSGDLADNGTAEEYAELRGLLEPLGLEPHVIPGNHDRRAPLREAFGLAGSGEDHVSYAVDLGPLRLIGLDSTIPGDPSGAGALDGGRLEWLDAELGRAPEQPMVIAMHHPPFLTAMPAFDEIGLAAAGREGLAEVLGGHPQVLRIFAGHVHRMVIAEVAGRAAVTAPSTYLQGALKFAGGDLGMTNDPPGFALHVLDDGVLTSQLQTLAPLG